MGLSNSKKKEKIAPSAVIYNLKGKEIPELENGYYNLGTNRKNKQSKTGSEYLTDETFHVFGTEEEMRAFYQINHITENTVCDTKGKNTILYAPNEEDPEKLPEDLVDAICPFNLFNLQTKARLKSLYDSDTFDLLIFVPLNFLYSPKYYQHERKTVESKDERGHKGVKQVALLKSIKPTSKKIETAGLFLVFNCRLNNVDGAESNTAQGTRATQLMLELFKSYNNIVYVRLGYPDKYGRMLVDLYADKEYKKYLNYYLVENPDPVLGVLATKYSGGEKAEYMKNLPKIYKS